MSRVFFLSANMTTEPYPVYPLGMAVCSAALAAKGHEVRQFDYLASEKSDAKLVASLEEFKPGYVCLSLRNIDSSDSYTSGQEWYLDRYKHLVAVVRSTCGVPVILGGPGFSIMPEQILAYVAGDYGVKGEGERAICELIRKLEQGETPPVIFAGGDPLRGLEMVSPLYEKELAGYYIRESSMLNLQTKRGCPYRCNYCTYPYLEGREIRPRDTRAVVDDIRRAQRDYGVQDFFFTDSVFNDTQGNHLELVEEILRCEVKIRWGSFFTPMGTGEKELALMKRSGLYAVELGTDAGCDRTLEGLGKSFTFGQVIDFNNACAANEIPCCHFVIFGAPNESEDTIAESLANFEKLKYCVVVGFSGIRIFPCTGLHRRAVQEGVIEADDPLLKPKYYISPGIEYDRMNRMAAEGLKGRHDRVFPPDECRARIAIVKNFGYKGLLWDKLIRYPKCRR